MRVLITGGTGFVGQALCPRLVAAGHEVVILTRQSDPILPQGVTTTVTRLDDLAPGEFGAVINLAGAPTGDARWSEPRKKLLLDSRVSTTSRLVAWMGRVHSRRRSRRSLLAAREGPSTRTAQLPCPALPGGGSEFLVGAVAQRLVSRVLAGAEPRLF
jgi:NAD dependent epimerase/dehydratase family enzyme